MALTCPVDFDTVTLRAEIQTMYSRVATTREEFKAIDEIRPRLEAILRDIDLWTG
jgi:hypothetical protein